MGEISNIYIRTEFTDRRNVNEDPFSDTLGI